MSKGSFIVLLAGLGLLPVWRSGLRTHLNFYEFIVNHTVFGPQVEYIPEEYLTRNPDEVVTEQFIQEGEELWTEKNTILA
jgi:hypothetical protein